MERYDEPERPKEYEYRSVNGSLADKYILRHWWPIAIKAIPKRMSANAVSILGSAFCWLAFLVLAGTPSRPISSYASRNPWIFGVIAFCLFAYQTLDALDGIQARRTGSSGPLGEFVDHWFDSINAFILPLGIALAFPAVPPELALAGVFLCGIADWMNSRSTLKTGTLVFGKFSSEEAISVAYLFFLSVWALGYDFWALPAPALGFAPVCLVYALAPLAYIVSSLIMAKDADRFDLLLLAAAQLLPLLAWAFAAVRRLGSEGLFMGGLLLGMAGTRIAGDLLRARVVGLAYSPIFPGLLAADAALLASAFIPGLPDWILPLSGISALACFASMLCMQFYRTIARVREVLGIGLFGAPKPMRADRGRA